MDYKKIDEIRRSMCSELSCTVCPLRVDVKIDGSDSVLCVHISSCAYCSKDFTVAVCKETRESISSAKAKTLEVICGLDNPSRIINTVLQFLETPTLH